MSKAVHKPYRKWTIVVVALLLVGFFGFRYWKAKRSELPKGIASGNGRIESQHVDVSSKLPLKVKELNVQEGDLVKPGQIVGQMDTVTLEAELAEANQKVAAAREALAVAKAGITRSKSQIELAKIEKERAKRLVAERAGSQRDYDVRSTALKTTTAGLAESTAQLAVAQENVKVAEANVVTIQSRIDDATLRSPVLGRVLYRLAEPGEVLGPGGKALTLVNLENIYMEIFLPSAQAGALKVGADARVTIDAAPGRVAQGTVSFVSPEAQFTPKQVETKSEREKLMFRVKIQIPQELVTRYVEQIKTGVRGVGYVKIRDDAQWPDWLQKNLVKQSAPTEQAPPPTTSHR
ncbi:MAG TPA: HlyD family efflux transporter periplasmic adaptor subunit [Kofleriaceae bacterium]|nr:HlyD family efflux transporter periplasmic adaptor subunit [Kofleriaceae bacterium]